MSRVLVPLLALSLLSCVSVPDVDDPLQFACVTAGDCIEDYECGSNGFCQPGPSSSECSSEAAIACFESNIWWLDSCDEPHAITELCPECCDDSGSGPTCTPCS